MVSWFLRPEIVMLDHWLDYLSDSLDYMSDLLDYLDLDHSLVSLKIYNVLDSWDLLDHLLKLLDCKSNLLDCSLVSLDVLDLLDHSLDLLDHLGILLITSWIVSILITHWFLSFCWFC